MGMCGEVIGFGQFQPELKSVLSTYGPYFEDLTSGDATIVCLFVTLEGNWATRRLASQLGVDDPWDWATHRIKLSAVDFDGLTLNYGAAQVEAFRTLLAAGYEFYFLPNG